MIGNSVIAVVDEVDPPPEMLAFKHNAGGFGTLGTLASDAEPLEMAEEGICVVGMCFPIRT